MATLADTFMADFDSSGEDEEEEVDEEEENNDESAFGELGTKAEKKGEEEEEPEFGDNDIEAEVNDLDDNFDDLDDMGDKPKSTGTVNENAGVAGISQLLSDPKLTKHMQMIEKYIEAAEEAREKAEEEGADGPRVATMAREEEYRHIVRSNEVAVELDNEISTVHKFVRDIYATKFPELEQLVHNPIDYAKTIQVIRNETDLTTVEADLVGIIPQTTILTISVTATTTVGKPLPPDSLKRCLEGCTAILDLNEHKIKLYRYIESRMFFIAPNLSAIVGPEIAARLLAVAGGLTQLAKMPACNVQVLGVRKKNSAGFSKAGQELHMGLLAATPIMQQVPSDLRSRSLKCIAGKVTLAARIDEFGQDPAGDQGKLFLADIQRKIDKWQEPPPPKKHKALAAPMQEYKKKRGGKRARKEKERLRPTELAKAKNKLLFGKPEPVDDFTGEGLGMIGQSGTGHLKVKKKEKQKGGHISRKMQARLKRVKSASSGTSGIASSVALESVTGIELVNPELKQKQLPAAKNAKKGEGYFSLSGEFFQVGQGAAKKQKTETKALPAVPKFG